ncbi:MAG: matrixin family metalloprotease [Sphingomonadaceae bacterium]|nr:matrixin family metalloprotease [Sphingomonadaceae bacterium]
MKNYLCSVAAISLLAALAACAEESGEPGEEAYQLDADLLSREDAVHKEAIDEARELVNAGGFEAFMASAYKEDFEGGGYIVNGDVFLPDEAALRAFYENEFVPMTTASPKFTLDVDLNGADNIWDEQQKRAITYCISTSFGRDYARVRDAMEAATAAWEEVADLDFQHVAAQDSACNGANAAVTFDVRPVRGQRYLARAFFPNYARASRNVMINDSGMDYPNTGPGLTLTGILRHELGHTIGARHEHIRPEAGVCQETGDSRPITNYDAYSVMHYPQCNGLGDWTLTLTRLDRIGAACIYGAAAGTNPDLSLCRKRVR